MLKALSNMRAFTIFVIIIITNNIMINNEITYWNNFLKTIETNENNNKVNDDVIDTLKEIINKHIDNLKCKELEKINKPKRISKVSKLWK